VDDADGPRRLDRTGRRLVVVETAGFALIVFAAAQLYPDPWRAVGAVGAGTIWVCQLIDRRTRSA
jgi:hypothetical protein